MKTLMIVSGPIFEPGTSQSTSATHFNVTFSKGHHQKENCVTSTKQISNHPLTIGVVLSHMKMKKRWHKNSIYKTECRKK
jgi:hypothetical protein